MSGKVSKRVVSSRDTRVMTKGALRSMDYSEFDTLDGWKPREGCLYTRTRAISARVNQNFDGWPSEELKKSYRSFLGKPVFVNHVNDDPTKARGRVVASRYVENGDDKYIEVIQEVNAEKFPMLARELITGGLDSVSMGCEAKLSVCSYCGNQARDLSEMCDHVLRHKGHYLTRRNASGENEEVLVYEECRDIGFFELSYVFDPADETALVSNVITANKKEGYGETKLPPHVDTLRDEEKDVEEFFIDPPEELSDPDLSENSEGGVVLDDNTEREGEGEVRRSSSLELTWREANFLREEIEGLAGLDPTHNAEGEMASYGSSGAVYAVEYDGSYYWEASNDNGATALGSGQASSLQEAKSRAEEALGRVASTRKRRASGPVWVDSGYGELYLVNDPNADAEIATVWEDPTAEGTYEWTVSLDAYNTPSESNGTAGEEESLEEAKRAAEEASRAKGLVAKRRKAKRGKSMSRKTRRFRADDSRNDQGKAEETFISETPAPEPVDTGDGEDAPNDTKDQRVETEEDRSGRDNLARKRRARRRNIRRRRADQSDDYDIETSEDISREVEDEEPEVSETSPETQPKDASRRRRSRRRKGGHETTFSIIVPEEGYGKLAPHEAWVGSDGDIHLRVQGDDTSYVDHQRESVEVLRETGWSDDDIIEAYEKYCNSDDQDHPDSSFDEWALERTASHRRHSRSFINQTQGFRSWFRDKYPSEDFDDFDEESQDEFLEEYLEDPDRSHYSKRRKRVQSRRRTAGEDLEVARPDGRVDVERPVENTTDDEAQSSQFDREDFGDNAGDDKADPDLSTDQNWAPGEGKKESRFTRKASQIQALKLAEAMAEVGIESIDDRWKLAESFVRLPEAIVQDRIALLEKVSTVVKKSPEPKVRRARRTAQKSAPEGFGSAPSLKKSSASRSDDYSMYF